MDWTLFLFWSFFGRKQRPGYITLNLLASEGDVFFLLKSHWRNRVRITLRRNKQSHSKKFLRPLSNKTEK